MLPVLSQKKVTAGQPVVVRYLSLAFLLVLGLMPFHAFLVTWLGYLFGHRSLWQGWKEILISLMVVGSCITLTKNRKLASYIVKYRPNQLITAYIVLHLVVGYIAGAELRPFLLALKINLEFLILFIIAQIVAFWFAPSKNLVKIRNIILISSTVVALFAVLQVFILPHDFLTHFGYGTSTIVPYQTIENSSLIRAFSTLGGPNQLGEYLLLPICLAAYFVQARRWIYTLPLALLLFALYLSQSRSAWIGAMVALGIMVLSKLSKKTILIVSSTVLVVAIALSPILFNSIKGIGSFQSIILHGDFQGKIAGSTQGHFHDSFEGLKTAVSHPLGLGPGSAGPASLISKRPNGAIIPENYYIQIAIEIGVIGLILFASLIFLVAKDLWKNKDIGLNLALFASFIGLAFVNLLLQGWADSTTSLLWWGVAGYVIRLNKRNQTVVAS